MIRYAEAEFELSRTEKGQSIRELLRQVEQASKKRIPELHPAPPPPELEYLWGWYMELHRARGDGPISYGEIEAWKRLLKRPASPLDIEILCKLDMAYERVDARHRSKSDG